jgi:hypothetical protein
MKRGFFGVAMACAAACAFAADRPLQIGPFAIGMTFDAARAITPTLAWRNSQVSPYTSKVLAIVAPDALQLGGLSHAVELRPGYYNSYLITLRHIESVADPVACERLTLDVLADLESRFGPFVPQPRYDDRPFDESSMKNSSMKLANGATVKVQTGKASDVHRVGPAPYAVVSAGKQSSLSFETDEDVSKAPKTANPHWRLGIAAHEAGDSSIRLESNYNRDEYSTPFCKLTTQLEYRPAAPAWETLTFAPSLLVRQPSIAIKHMSLEGVTLPASTVDVDLTCRVDRHTGALDCASNSVPAPNEKILEAALRRALTMRVDTTKLDPDNPWALRMDFKVTLAQSERRAVDFLQAPLARMSDFEWVEQPTAQDLDAAYPKGLQSAGVEALVALTCQVQSDLSLLCAATDPEPAGGDPKTLDAHRKLAWASVAVMSLYQSAPTLRTGEPAIGAVVKTKVDFRLRD